MARWVASHCNFLENPGSGRQVSIVLSFQNLKNIYVLLFVVQGIGTGSTSSWIGTEQIPNQPAHLRFNSVENGCFGNLVPETL
jgi:hypothetical protein